jgi:SAM-dependent methyltransferase
MSPGTACLAQLPYESGLLATNGGQQLRPGGPALTERVVARARFQAPQRVVDVGCGMATSLAYLRRLGIHAVGIDPSADALARARERNGDLPLIQAGCEHLPFAPGSMDGMLAECCLSVVADLAAALAECWRVLVPDGRLAVTDLYAQNPAAAEPIDVALPRCLAGIRGRDSWMALLESAGFRLDVWEDHCHALRGFLARFIMEHGSPMRLWTRAAADDEQARRIDRAVQAVRPGYFLLVASKRMPPCRPKEFPP